MTDYRDHASFLMWEAGAGLDWHRRSASAYPHYFT